MTDRPLSFETPDGFPKHVALTIEHNPHRVFYQPLAEYLGPDEEAVRERFVSEDDEIRCFAMDELWELTWHPDTPDESCTAYAATWDSLVEFMKDVIADG